MNHLVSILKYLIFNFFIFNYLFHFNYIFYLCEFDFYYLLFTSINITCFLFQLQPLLLQSVCNFIFQFLNFNLCFINYFLNFNLLLVCAVVKIYYLIISFNLYFPGVLFLFLMIDSLYLNIFKLVHLFLHRFLNFL